MHQQLSPEAKAIVDAIHALPTKDRLFRMIDICEIKAAINVVSEENDAPMLELAQSYRSKRFVHRGCAFTYTAPMPLYYYDHIPQWEKLKQQQKKVESMARESYKAGTMGLDTKGMMPPAVMKYRKAFVSIQADGKLSMRRRSPFAFRKRARAVDPNVTTD